MAGISSIDSGATLLPDFTLAESAQAALTQPWLPLDDDVAVAVNDPPVVDTSVTLEIGSGAQLQTISNLDLLIVDSDTSTDELIFTLVTNVSNGSLQNDGVVLGIGDTFTQADIDSGKLKYNNNGTAGADGFDFTLSDGVSALADSFSLFATDSVQRELSPGITLNKDGGDGAYLYDPTGLNHVVGDTHQTWEFIFSNLERNDSGGQSTLYSAHTSGTHYNHLVVLPSGEVQWFMQGWANEGLSSGLTYHNSVDAIPDLFDGGMHSIAIVFDLRFGEHYFQLYIDGRLVNEIPSGFPGSTITLTADFPYVLGQKLQSVDTDDPTDPDKQLHFVQGEQFSGTIHDVRKWDSIRTAAEIADTRFARIDVTDTPAPADLHVNWQMDTLNGNDTVVNATGRTGPNGEPITLEVRQAQSSGFNTSAVSDILRVDENTLSGQTVGFVTPRDPSPDANGYSYELLVDSSGAFAIDALTGKLTVADASRLDYESADSHNIIVRATSTEVAGVTYSEDIFLQINPINETPQLNNVTGAGSYTEATAAVVIEPGITVFDPELSAIDSFGGATLSIWRASGSDPDDVFGAAGDLSPLISGDPLVYAGTAYGTVIQNDSSILQLQFSAATTNVVLNAILQSLTYRNTSDTLSGDADLLWLFDDQNTGSQGKGLASAAAATTIALQGVNDAPQFTNINNPVAVTEQVEAVPLTANVTVTDAEMLATNYAGAELVVERFGGANASDTFSASGLLAGLTQAGALVYGGVDIGTVTNNSGGRLSLQFNASASESLVNDTLRAIVYENSSDDPASLYQLQWSILDHNAGAQGSGGGKSDSLLQTIDLTAVNDDPVLLVNQLNLNEGETADINSAVLQTVDVDNSPGELQYTITDLSGGHFAAASNPTTAISTFTEQDVLDETLVFVHDGSETPPAYKVTYGDADYSATVQATVNFNAVNDPPVLSGSLPATVTLLEDALTSIDLSTASLSDSDIGANDLTLTLTSTTTALTPIAFGLLNVTGAGSNNLTLSGPVSEFNQWLSAPAALELQGASNDNGTNTDSIALSITDNGHSGSGFPSVVSLGNIGVDITPVNDAPGGNNGSVSVNEDSEFTFTTSVFGFSDSSDTGAGHALQSVLVESVPASGTLLLNGSPITTASQISAVDIDAGRLRYLPAANDFGSGYAAFGYRVQDSGGTANGGIDLSPAIYTMTIDVVAIADAPVGTAAGFTLNEDTARTLQVADFGFSDPHDNDNFTGITLTTLPANGTLTLGTTPVAAGNFVAVADIIAGNLVFRPAPNEHGASYAELQFQVHDDGTSSSSVNAIDQAPKTMAFDVIAVNDPPVGADATLDISENTEHVFIAADFGFSDAADSSDGHSLIAVEMYTLPSAGTLLLNGIPVNQGDSVSAIDIDSGLLRFQPDPDAFASPYTTFDFRVQDSGGNANGGIALGVAANTLTFNVHAVANPPAGTDSTRTLNEDSDHVLQVNDFGFSDPLDNHSFTGITLTSVPTAGVLSLGSVPQASGDFIPVSDITAGLLIYRPDANNHGAGVAHVEFQVHDDGVSADPTKTADQTPNRMVFDVAPVNDAPFAMDRALNLDEDTPHVFTAAEFGFSDPDDTGDNHALMAVQIAALPSSGVLQLSGVDVVAGDLIAAADISAGLLRFLPAANAFGNAYATIGFQVQDSGGTDNGGVDVSTAANTLTLDVAAVADAPAGTDAIRSLDEDTVYSLQIGDFGFTDPHDNHNFSGITLTNLPAAGNLALNSAALAAGDFIPVSDIAAGALTYRPDPNDHGVGYARFEFQVHDDGVVSNPADRVDPSPNQMVFDVDAVNDAPIAADRALSLDEDAAHVFAVAEFGFNDPGDSADGHTLAAVQVTALPAAGRLELNGLSVDPGDVISIAEIDAGWLRYLPPSNAFGDAYATIVFRVQDSGGDANGGVDLSVATNTLTIDVAAVADAPSGADAVRSLLEDTVYVLKTEDFGFSDVHDNHNFAGVTVTSSPDAGILEVSSVAVSAGDFLSVGDIAAGLVQFRPEPDQHGGSYAAIEFKVHDDGVSSDVALTIDPTSKRLTFDVDAVNDAPRGSDSIVSIDEDTIHIFTPEQFGFNDTADSGDGHSFVAVQFTALPATGRVELDGSLVSQGAVVAVADINAGQLRYTPPDNAYGSDYANVAFRVQDSGGSDNAANDFSTGPNSLTIDINPVNDPPELQTLSAGEVREGGMLVLQRDHLQANDVDSDADFLNYQVSNPFQHGSLLRNGDVISSFTQSEIDAGKIVYQHHGDEIFADSMQFTLSDAVADSASAGIDASLDITILPVNDHAPVALADEIAVIQGGMASQLTSGTLTVLANDTDADLPAAQLQVTLALAPEHGTVSLDPDGSFIYQHDGSANYSDTFTYIVHDGSIGAAAVRTSEGQVLVTVSPENAAPVAELIMPQTTPADETFLFPIPADTFSDADPDDVLALSATQANGDVLPAWLSFDPATGVFSGTPGTGDAGTIVVAVTAKDAAGIAVTTVFEITVEPMVGAAAPEAESDTGQVAISVDSEWNLPVSAATVIESSRLVIEKAVATPDKPLSAATMALQPQDSVVVNNSFVFAVVNPVEQRLSTWQEAAAYQQAKEFDYTQDRAESMLSLEPVDRELHDRLALWLEQTWQRDAEQSTSNDALKSGASVALSAGISVGYILWLLRSELLLASVLSAMPAWRLVDPVPVLNSVSNVHHNENDESLDEMVAESTPLETPAGSSGVVDNNSHSDSPASESLPNGNVNKNADPGDRE